MPLTLVKTWACARAQNPGLARTADFEVLIPFDKVYLRFTAFTVHQFPLTSAASRHDSMFIHTRERLVGEFPIASGLRIITDQHTALIKGF